ncbi:MAG: hypothetical protein M3162_08960, partial [Thermoproteota archaeon]|nr:hypothetical protein [Thermoproteota archaeon]
MKRNNKVDSNLVSTIKLKVADSKLKDKGKKKAFLGNMAMNRLGIINGDVIEIAGKKVTAVVVNSIEDKTTKNNYIYIDSQTRNNAGVGLNEYVVIRKTNPKPAQKIVFLSNTVQGLSEEFVLFLNIRFDGMPVTKGDKFSLNFLGSSIVLLVNSTLPKEIVKIDKNTKIIVKPRLPKSFKNRQNVTYEQIGGLKEQIS